MMSKIDAENLVHSNSDSSRGIAGRGVTITTATSSVAIRTIAPILRQSSADNGSTSSEADISRISRSRGGSSARGERGKCGAHNTRLLPTATPIAASGRQTGSTSTPISPKSVLRVFLGSAARGIFVCETTSTRSSAFHSQRERSSPQVSP